jgi:hypothetical protein
MAVILRNHMGQHLIGKTQHAHGHMFVCRIFATHNESCSTTNKQEKMLTGRGVCTGERERRREGKTNPHLILATGDP